MTKFRTVVFAAVTAVVFAASPAAAQLPDLPGMDLVNEVTDGQAGAHARAQGDVPGADTGMPADADGSVNLPGADTLADTDSGIEAAGTVDDDASIDAAPVSSADDLPRTGAPIVGFALAGVALVAGGRLLVELVAPRG